MLHVEKMAVYTRLPQKIYVQINILKFLLTYIYISYDIVYVILLFNEVIQWLFYK